MRVELDPKLFSGFEKSKGQISLGDGDAVDWNGVIGEEPFIGVATPYIGEFHLSFTGQIHLEELVSYTLPQQHSSYVQPFAGYGIQSIQKRAFCFIGRERGGRMLMAMALSHRDMHCWFEVIEGSLVLKGESGSSREANQVRPCIVVVTGDSIQSTLNRGWRVAFEATGAIGKMRDRKPQLPNWLNSFGYSAGRGDDLTHGNIIAEVNQLKSQGFLPRYVIVEEGWQQLARNPHERGGTMAMINFQADTRRFPAGLKGLVEDLKEIGVEHVGVWHGMMGHRGGIHPQLARQYDLPPDDHGRYFLGYDLGRTFQFYYDYYGFLRGEGISFVKVSDQGSPPIFCRRGMDSTKLSSQLQVAIQSAAATQFNSIQLNEECLRPENLLYWATSRIAKATRAIPLDTPQEVSKMLQNALGNSVWLSQLMHLNLPEWKHAPECQELIAIFYALSDSIFTLGSVPNDEERRYFEQMQLPGGHLIRADRPLSICADSFFTLNKPGNRLVKAQTVRGKTRVCGLFYFSEDAEGPSHQGRFSLNELDGLKGDQYAVWSYQKGYLGVVERDGEIEIEVAPNKGDVLTFMRVRGKIAVIGSPYYYLMSGPIRHVNLEEENLYIHARCAAPIAIYCDREVLEVRRNNEVVPWDYCSEQRLLVVEPGRKPEAGRAFYTVAFES